MHAKYKPSTYSINLVDLGTPTVISSIKGSVEKLGQKYQNATIVLFGKNNLQAIAIRKPDSEGDYQFNGLGANLKTFIVAFDQNQQFNAVIQDNVVPK